MNHNKKQTIVIGMPVRNAQATIKKSVESVLQQKNVKMNLVLLIVNDNSTDDSIPIIKKNFRDNRIRIVNVNLGKIHEVRNFIINYAREHIDPNCYIGRLDADDVLCNRFVLENVEQIITKKHPDVLFMGNKLRQNGKIIDRKNFASRRLLNPDFLLQKLQQMSNGIPEGELPSCNTFFKVSVDIEYPNVESAEDHWLTVNLLLKSDQYKIYIAEKILYCIYSLDGNVTKKNKHFDNYFTSRQVLYQHAKNFITGNKDERKKNRQSAQISSKL